VPVPGSGMHQAGVAIIRRTGHFTRSAEHVE
jgi:hypothetical protein